jgi:uncharacterized membrane protein YdbT with pleckstrin-like domain
MSYVEGSLVPGERIIYRAHLHWNIFVVGTLVCIMFAGGALILASYDPSQQGLAFLMFLVGLLPLTGAFIRYRCSEFAVTDKRVLIKTGIVRRQTMETLLNKVENISVQQSLLGRILNFGTIRVTGTGSTQETFANIADPLEFRKQVQAATLNYEAGKAAGVFPSTPSPEREERDCPYCAERILAKAKVCRFCGRDVTHASAN